MSASVFSTESDVPPSLDGISINYTQIRLQAVLMYIQNIDFSLLWSR